MGAARAAAMSRAVAGDEDGERTGLLRIEVK
jgi:hypothetical protein